MRNKMWAGAALIGSAVIAGAAFAAGADTPDYKALGQRWWAEVSVLGSDEMEGRFTGTPGYARAAAHVADQFKSLGLEPAGSDGWYQPIDFRQQVIADDQSKVSLTSGGADTPLILGPEMLLSGRLPLPPHVDGDLVFIGYGLHMPDVGYDDFAGDLKGKILVQVTGGPKDVSAALKSHARANETAKAIARVGALGLISIPNPKSMDIPWARQIGLAKIPGIYHADAELRDAPSVYFQASVNPEKAEKLFAKSGHTFAEILALANQDAPLPRFALNQGLKADVTASTSPLSSSNVVARLPGSDPSLSNEVVVLSAHLDHLGIAATPIGGKSIYRGAMDNASGVASLIESARAMTASGKRPKRTIIFLAVTGEERGLLGSRAYAVHPTGLGVAKIVANVNMDMYLPLWPLKSLTALGADQSSLGAVVEGAVKAAGLTLLPDPEPNRNLFIRSDQYNFIRKGVPALALKFAATNPQEKAISAAFLQERYHGLNDDLDQPVDLEAAAKFNLVLADMIRAIADAPTRPTWNADSFFKRYAAP